MRGPIDYIIVGFEGSEFNGNILRSLVDPVENGVISIVALSAIIKDKDGAVTTLSIADFGDEYIAEFSQKYVSNPDSPVDAEDIDEMADLLENDTAAGLLVVEQLWAKPLKQALIDANGVLVAEGRVHPDVAEELDESNNK